MACQAIKWVKSCTLHGVGDDCLQWSSTLTLRCLNLDQEIQGTWRTYILNFSERLLVLYSFKKSTSSVVGYFLLMFWLFCVSLHAQEGVAELKAQSSAEQMHIDAIRLHKKNHFNAKRQDPIGVSSQALDALPNSDRDALTLSNHACTYESDIAKKPPFKTVSLTFDDGPSPERTEFILSILEKYNIPAAFFLIGESAKKHPQLVAKILSSGHHLIGNHSWEHPNFHDIDIQKQEFEIQQSELELSSYTQEKYFRYPFGNSTCASNALLHELGYKIVGWHVDSCDWAFDKTGHVSEHDAQICEVRPHNASSFIDHTLEAVNERGGGILLLHEIHPNTLMQLEPLIERLLSEGFRFERIDAQVFRGFMN